MVLSILRTESAVCIAEKLSTYQRYYRMLLARRENSILMLIYNRTGKVLHYAALGLVV